MSQPIVKSGQRTTDEEIVPPLRAMDWTTALPFGKAGLPMLKTPDEIANLHRETADVLARACSIMTEGLKEIGHHVLTLTQSSVEAHLTAGNSAFKARTLKDMAEIQSAWFRHFFDAAISGSTKLSALSAKVVTETSEPIHAHISETFGKIDGIV